MALPTQKTADDFPFKHSGQPDEFGSSIGDLAEIQADFDSRAEFNQTQINAIIAALQSVTADDSGGKNIGIEPIANLPGAVNVYEALLAASQLPNLTEVINARASTVKSKTFANLDARLEESESDMADISKYVHNETELRAAITTLSIVANWGTIAIARDCIITLTDDLIIPVKINLIGDNSKVSISNLKSVLFKGQQFCTGIIFDGGNACNTIVSIEGSDVDFFRNTIQNVKAISATTGRGLYIQANAVNTHVFNNKFINPQAYSASPVRAIVVEKVEKCRIHDNEFSGMVGIDDGDYIYVSCLQVADLTEPKLGGYYFDYTDVCIYNNVFHDTTKSAVKLQGSGVNVFDNVIYAKSDGCTYAIRGTNLRSGEIHGNTLISDGVQLQIPVSMINCVDTHVNDNTLRLNLNSGSMYLGVFDTCARCEFLDNKVTTITTIAGGGARLHLLNSDDLRVNINHFYKAYVSTDGLQNSKINKNIFDGYVAMAVDMLDTGSASNNIDIEDNIAYTTDRFVGLRTNDKTGIKILNNKVNESTTPTDSASLVAFYFGGQTMSEVMVYGNTPWINWDYGDTAHRPTTKKSIGYKYYDTDLGVTMTWNGTAWVDNLNSLYVSEAYNPPSINSLAVTYHNTTVLGAVPGDYAVASFSIETQYIIMYSTVVSTNIVQTILFNPSGSPIDLGSGTLKVRVIKA